MAIACNDFNSLFLRQLPFFEKAILKDFAPQDNAWIGQMKNEQFDPFTGSEHTYDQVHRVFPDLTNCWTPFNTDAVACHAAACDTPETVIGTGMTRRTFGLEKTSIRTKVYCFDELTRIPQVKKIVANVVDDLRLVTLTTLSDRNRRAALENSPTIYIAGSAGLTVETGTDTFPDCVTIDLGSEDNLPTSLLTIPFLQSLVPMLALDGYFKNVPMTGQMLRLITDPTTQMQLTNGNPQLISLYKITDFARGGELYKYGMSMAVGNFGISYDHFPKRYNHIGGGVLRRVFPYTNVDATVGLKQQASVAYNNAMYQMNYIWHPEGLVRATSSMVSIHPEMPYLNRNLGGKWYFTGPESDMFQVTDPATGQVCTYDNRRRNKGFFWADYSVGYKPEYMQWTRAILSQRDPGCVSNQPRCSADPGYVIQDNNAANDLCLEED